MAEFVPTPETTRELRDAFGQFATGVTIVTAQTAEGPVGITANSFSSVSLTPPMVLWCPDKGSKRYAAFAEASHYAIHVLAADQNDLCWQVAKDGYCLSTMDLDENAYGVPLIEGCLARFECRTAAIYDGGDHAIILGDVLRVNHRSDGAPLLFHGGTVREISSNPATA